MQIVCADAVGEERDREREGKRERERRKEKRRKVTRGRGGKNLWQRQK